MTNRSVQLICNVEQELASLAWTITRDQNLTMSSYLRTLIIKDLKARDVISQEMIEELLYGA